MDGLWQALHHSVRLPFFSVSFWVNTIDLSETASTWRVFLPSPPPPIHPSRKRDRVTWFSAKLAFDSLSKLFHCCRIHEHPCGLSPPSYFFFLFLVYSVEIDLPLPIKRARRLEKGGGAVEQGGEMTEVEGIFRKLRDVKLLWGSSSLSPPFLELVATRPTPAPNSPTLYTRLITRKEGREDRRMSPN